MDIFCYFKAGQSVSSIAEVVLRYGVTSDEQKIKRIQQRAVRCPVRLVAEVRRGKIHTVQHMCPLAYKLLD